MDAAGGAGRRGDASKSLVQGMKINFPVAALVWMAVIAVTIPASTQAAAPTPPLSGSAFPPPDSIADVTQAQQEYVIGPLDTLDIAVYRVDSLSRTVQVDSGGDIELPLVGTIVALGKTPRQLSAEIAAKLQAKFIESPQVTVLVKSSLNQKITITGSVLHPGVYDAVGRMTLMQAVAVAQGTGELANKKDVVVFRMIDKRRVAAVFNLTSIEAGKVTDPQVYPNDIIVVAESGSKKTLHNIIGLAPLFVFLTPLL